MKTRVEYEVEREDTCERLRSEIVLTGKGCKLSECDSCLYSPINMDVYITYQQWSEDTNGN